MKVRNDAGEEIEVFTPEEAKAQAEAATTAERERLEAEHLATITQLEADLAEKEDELKKLQDKDYNFSQLRNKKGKEEDDASKKLAQEIADLRGEISTIKTQPFEKAKADFMAVNKIDVDKDTKEKFEFFFKPLAAQAKSAEDFQAALTGAFAAATGGQRQPSFEGMMVSTRITPPSSGSGVVSTTEREIGSKLGITDADRQKYGPNKKK